MPTHREGLTRPVFRIGLYVNEYENEFSRQPCSASQKVDELYADTHVKRIIPKFAMHEYFENRRRSLGGIYGPIPLARAFKG